VVGIPERYPYELDAHCGELAHHYGRTDNTTMAVEYVQLDGCAYSKPHREGAVAYQLIPN
jgi:hypothetical protein